MANERVDILRQLFLMDKPNMVSFTVREHTQWRSEIIQLIHEGEIVLHKKEGRKRIYKYEIRERHKDGRGPARK